MDSTSMRAWLGRLALAAAIGLGIGLLIYLVARGISGITLLGQQRELLSGVAQGLGGLDGPPSTDLRAARKTLQALDAQYAQISALAGLLIGTLAAVVGYTRLERQTSQ